LIEVNKYLVLRFTLRLSFAKPPAAYLWAAVEVSGVMLATVRLRQRKLSLVFLGALVVRFYDAPLDEKRWNTRGEKIKFFPLFF